MGRKEETGLLTVAGKVERIHGQLTSLTIDISRDPKRVAKMLNALFAEEEGNMVSVAARMGVSRSTMKRWVARLEKAGFRIHRAAPGGSWSRRKVA